MRCVLRPMDLIEVTERCQRPLRLLRPLQILLDLSPNVTAHRVGNRQILVIAAAVDRGQHGEQRLTRVQRDRRTLPHAKRRDQP